jgi:hypothetical protein
VRRERGREGAREKERERMGTEAGGAEEGGAEMVVEPSSKDQQQQSKALDKLTDRVVDDRQLDSSRVQEVIYNV